nr:MAG TPA: hypothetical protein [Caudoviricetes sp.]
MVRSAICAPRGHPQFNPIVLYVFNVNTTEQLPLTSIELPVLFRNKLLHCANILIKIESCILFGNF